MCARLVKKIWCDYIIDCSCYSEENKNRHNILCATAWITIVAKSDVWIAITFSLLMQMPRFTYHFNSFNLLFKAVPNLVQNIAFEKNIPVPSNVNESVRKASKGPHRSRNYFGPVGTRGKERNGVSQLCKEHGVDKAHNLCNELL